MSSSIIQQCNSVMHCEQFPKNFVVSLMAYSLLFAQAAHEVTTYSPHSSANRATSCARLISSDIKK